MPPPNLNESGSLSDTSEDDSAQLKTNREETEKECCKTLEGKLRREFNLKINELQESITNSISENQSTVNALKEIIVHRDQPNYFSILESSGLLIT